ncbi:MAG: PIN domain-containing protein [Ruminiclostridium sp.]
MAIYLIDFENVHSDGLKGIEQLAQTDICYVFYSEHAGVLTFNIHKKIIESKAKIYYVEAQVGMKNALDFQLVSYLGYMIRENQEASYCVISNDRAFALVADFWKNKGVDVASAVSLAAAVRLKENEKTASQLALLIPDKQEREFVAKCIEELSTKQGINNRIAKKYGTTRAGEIYKLIKPLIADKKGGTEKDA